jgi:hypothetical protein
MKHWMFNCRRVSEKVSASLDGTLPWHHRMMIRFHMLMCTYCTDFRRQLRIIRKTGRCESSSGKSEPVLSEQARERISKVLKDSA